MDPAPLRLRSSSSRPAPRKDGFAQTRAKPSTTGLANADCALVSAAYSSIRKSLRSRSGSPSPSAASISPCVRSHTGAASASSFFPCAVKRSVARADPQDPLSTFTRPRRSSGFTAAVKVVRSIASKSAMAAMPGAPADSETSSARIARSSVPPAAAPRRTAAPVRAPPSARADTGSSPALAALSAKGTGSALDIRPDMLISTYLMAVKSHFFRRPGAQRLIRHQFLDRSQPGWLGCFVTEWFPFSASHVRSQETPATPQAPQSLQMEKRHVFPS